MPTPVLTQPPATPTPSPTPSGSPLIDHPTGERDVVLRMSIYPGLPYPGITIERPPVFTLYGGGHAIYTVLHGAGQAAQLDLRHAQLSDEQVDALLADALGRGGLATANERYDDVTITDMSTTIFEIHAGGVDKTVWVYALGDFDRDAPSAAERARFQPLAVRLGNFAGDVDTGKAEDLGPYEAEAYRATLARPFNEAFEPNAEWPWPELEPADFEQDADGNLQRIITNEQGKAVADLGIAQDLVAIGPDEVAYLIRIRPLLPDELP